MQLYWMIRDDGPYRGFFNANGDYCEVGDEERTRFAARELTDASATSNPYRAVCMVSRDDVVAWLRARASTPLLADELAGLR